MFSLYYYSIITTWLCQDLFTHISPVRAEGRCCPDRYRECDTVQTSDVVYSGLEQRHTLLGELLRVSTGRQVKDHTVMHRVDHQDRYVLTLGLVVLVHEGTQVCEDHLNDVRREATIMGDKDIPYRIIKKVMASCTEAGFARISLAVLQKPLEEA